jgi:hypothetical protein
LLIQALLIALLLQLQVLTGLLMMQKAITMMMTKTVSCLKIAFLSRDEASPEGSHSHWAPQSLAAGAVAEVTWQC